MRVDEGKKTSIALIAAICTTLIATSSLKMGLSIGLAILAVLFLATLLVNIIKNRAPANMLILFYVVFIAFFTSLIDLLFQAYIPEVYGELGLHLPIIIFTTCIIIRVVYNDDSYSIGMTIKTSIYLLLTMTAIGTIRELIGKGLSSTLEYPTALVIIGFLFAIVSGIVRKQNLT